jgi:hypothetical protein
LCKKSGFYSFQFRQSYKSPLLVEYDDETGMIRPQQTVDDEVSSGILVLFDSVLASKLQHRHEHLFYQVSVFEIND